MDKKLIKALAAAAILVAGMGSASAADFEITEEISPVWDGFYGGVGFGYGWSKDTVSVEGVDTIAGLFDESIGVSDESALSSIHLGYLSQSGNFVFGGEVAGILSDFNSTASASESINLLSSPDNKGQVYGFFANTEDTVEVQTSGMFTLAGRLGYAQGKTLFYGMGGLASAEIKTNVASTGQAGLCLGFNCDVDNGFDPANPALDTGLLDGDASGQTSERHYGFVVGGGIQHMVTEYLSFGVQYDFTKLGAKTHNGNFAGGIALFGRGLVPIDEEYSIRVDPDGIHQVKVTGSIHFN